MSLFSFSTTAVWSLILVLRTSWGQDDAVHQFNLAQTKLADTLLSRFASLGSVWSDPARAVRVNLTYIPMAVLELDEVSQTMSTISRFHLEWEDIRLTWNVSQYGGIDMVRFLIDKFWKPDLIVRNNVDMSMMFPGSIEDVGSATADGLVLWDPVHTFRTICKLDLKKFPFDTQKCKLFIQTWYTDVSNVQIHVTVDMNSFFASNEWELVNIIHSALNASNKSGNSFEYVLRRHSSNYLTKLLLPLVALSIVNCAVFLLPAASGERLSMSITTMLSFTIFLSYIGENTPANSQDIPYIAIYVSLNLALGVVAVFCNVVVVNLHFSKVDPDAVDTPGKGATWGRRVRDSPAVLKDPDVPIEDKLLKFDKQSNGDDIRQAAEEESRRWIRSCKADVGFRVNALDKVFFSVLFTATLAGIVWVFVSMLS